MRDMKKVMMIMVLSVLMACLVPAYAQPTQQWQSTSTMRGAGSTYTPQVTAVGATTIYSTTTTTANYSPVQQPGGPNRIGPPTPDGPGVPIGDALIPLTLLLIAYAVYRVARVYRRRRKA